MTDSNQKNQAAGLRFELIEAVMSKVNNLLTEPWMTFEGAERLLNYIETDLGYGALTELQSRVQHWKDVANDRKLAYELAKDAARDFKVERDELKAENERLKKRIITDEDDFNVEVDKLRADLAVAVETINQMQGKIRPYMNSNNSFGKALTDAFNLGALFNAQNPELFNAYLAKIQGKVEPKPKIEVVMNLSNEKCPNCGSTEFMVARDMLATRHCIQCHHQWVKVEYGVTCPECGNKNLKQDLQDTGEYGCACGWRGR
jgi:FtsZ-binding cell division protein ZapB/RNA polymerase subunit RPABC4/transcription elongation factor Spt4